MFSQLRPSHVESSPKPDGEPEVRRPNPEGPWHEVERLAGPVTEPVLAAARVLASAQVEGKKLRIQFSGKPRVGSIQAFIELWKTEPGRPADVILEEVTASTPTPETSSSTYLFTYSCDNPQALQAFADSVISKFEERAIGLPTPVDDVEFGMSVEVTPDHPDQLSNVLTLLKTFAEERHSSKLINLRALVGRRLFKVSADGKSQVPYACLDFVLGFPQELVRYAGELPEAVRQLGASRNLGENWDVTFGSYYGGVDRGAGQPTPRPKAGEPAPSSAD